MYKKLILALFALVFITEANAQGFTVSGRLRDPETNASLQGATVTLRSIRDSNNRETAYTDTSGRFQFDGVARDSFRISFSYVGYETLTRSVKVDSANVELGNVTLPRSSKELAGVVVVGTTPPATQKNDTIQFNASQYKVNPDAMSEDLVRKIPGITVENGQVKANGENVQKVTIDGRELFGDDATAALRNLPAEVIDKIQVFDRLSDQAQFTGFDDGNTNKGINIITKANMRNGQFGRLFAGYGTDERYSAGGNTTFFKNNRRVSLVGNFNNVNQQNFSQQDLLGVTSSGNNRGGGGGGGNRGGGQRPQGGGSFQGGGNFTVGQQAGINRTNAFGVNFSDIWGKKKNLTVTGSYFFNNTKNTTSEIASTEYFATSRQPFDRTRDTTTSESRNTNHRVNLRFEYRIDSSNQLIITPSLSFQENSSDRRVGRLVTYRQPNVLDRIASLNTTESNRSGNNINNSILFRHSFPKRGRTFTINLNTAYNKRLGETYVNTFQDNYYYAGDVTDTASQRFTDQKSDGLTLSTNLNYTEPLSAMSQLQINYNPSFTKNTADQQAFARDPASNKYSVFLNDFSNQFENRTTAHNAGVAYRWGNRDKQISFGANYQHTNLQSDRFFPTQLKVDKSFDNILPNARIQYKLSPKSSIRLMYRANVNQPSVTQLQDVVDPVNAPNYTVGNSDLNQQFTHILSTQYTFTNTAKGLLLVGNLFLQSAQNYISTAMFTSNRDTVVNGVRLDTGFVLRKPVNLDGYRSLRSFVTFALPMKGSKTNLNLNGGFTYSQLPGYTNYVQTETKNYLYTLGTVLASNISQYVDFTVSYSANFNQVNATSAFSKTPSNTSYFQHTASVQLNLLSKNGWFYQTDFNNQYYTGVSGSGDQSFNLWNMGVGKKFLKDRKGELKLSVFDALKQNRAIVRNVTTEGIEDIQSQVLQRYFMLTFTYNLRNFGTPAARAANNQQRRMMGGGGPGGF